MVKPSRGVFQTAPAGIRCLHRGTRWSGAFFSPPAERVLPSIIQETLKSVIAQYNASQLLTMREVRPATLSLMPPADGLLLDILSLRGAPSFVSSKPRL